MSMGVDNALAVHRDQRQGRVSVNAVDDHRRGDAFSCTWVAARRLTSVSRRQARWHPIRPLHDDMFVIFPCHASTRRWSSPARWWHHRWHHLNHYVSDRNVYPHEDVNHQHSSWTSVISSADLDDQQHIDPGPCDDIHGTGPDQPTDPGRPTGCATLQYLCVYVGGTIWWVPVHTGWLCATIWRVCLCAGQLYVDVPCMWMWTYVCVCRCHIYNLMVPVSQRSHDERNWYVTVCCLPSVRD